MLLYSCSNSNNQSQENYVVSISDINKLENELFSQGVGAPDIIKAKELAELYTKYADLYPDDSISPEFLYKASDISMNVGYPKATIKIFDKILSRYPDYVNVPTIMFLKGFVYEDQLLDYSNAKKCYLEFLSKYPDNDFSDDATASLNNLGKSSEDLIKEFEEANKNNK